MFTPPRIRSCLALVVVLSTMLPVNARGQDLDSRGRSFWLGFMSNNGTPDTRSDIRLYLSARRPTTARITWAFSGATTTVVIPTSNQTVAVDISGLFNTPVDVVDMEDVLPNRSNEISRKAIHVEADDEIAVVGMNNREKSSDAFLGLPEDVLTGEYIVMAHRNGRSSGGGQGGVARIDMPSQFIVVGMRDSTRVRIEPLAGVRLNGRTDAPFTIQLDAGEVFFGQAQLVDSIDVTGTAVVADKPVAVFGGVKRAGIPTYGGFSRDHLVEQMPPLSSWGRNALITPHYPIEPALNTTPLYRIVAAFGPTDVTITGRGQSLVYALSAGEWVERPLVEAVSVVASGPILAAQIERSTRQGGGGAGLGDPFIMLIPPVEQFDTSYTIQAPSYSGLDPRAHFINVIAPLGGAASVSLDGSMLVNPTWLPIAGSRFVYAQVNVSAGSHYVRADSPFAVFSYGFGDRISYGYPGAMVFRHIVRDTRPPDILWSQECGLFHGTATDSRISDTGIDSLYATSETVNVAVSIPTFAPGADTVSFTARLIDRYLDGVVAVRAIDSTGLSYTQKINIPGFTVAIGGMRGSVVQVDTVVALNSRDFCRRIPLINYGRFAHSITALRIADSTPSIRVTTPMPATILPGDTLLVEVCFSNVRDTTFALKLTISDSCQNELVCIVPVLSLTDTSAPGIERDHDGCADIVTVTYTKQQRASRIASIEVESLVNCTAEVLNDPTTGPLPIVRVRFHRIDPYRDMMYAVTVVDSVGNVVVDRDTLGGFTIATMDRYRDSVGFRWNREWVGDTIATSARRCDSIEVVNYGSDEVTLAGVRVRGNVQYSIPPSQFPLSIPRGANRWITVCIESQYPVDGIDTLDFWDACGHGDAVALRIAAGPLLGLAVDGCGGRIEVSVYEAARRNFMNPPVPNPMRDVGYVDIGLSHDNVVTVELLDLRGVHVATLVDGAHLPAGLMRLTFDMTPLDAGSYMLRLVTSDGTVVTQQFVVPR